MPFWDVYPAEYPHPRGWKPGRMIVRALPYLVLFAAGVVLTVLACWYAGKYT